MSKQKTYAMDEKGRRVRLNRKGKPKTHHLLVFFACLFVSIFVATAVFINTVPSKMTEGFRQAILVDGLGTGAPIPVNTLYTAPDIASPDTASITILTTGNQDTLYTGAWLDLSAGPLVLQVPDMDDRYYSIQFTDPQHDSVFAYVGRRTTGTGAGTFLITGPGWNSELPEGMTQIASPGNEVFLLARVFVTNAEEVPLVYELSKQITLEPL
jgi:hypothetical protein